MERQLANLTGLVQKALTQPTTLQIPGRDGYRGKQIGVITNYAIAFFKLHCKGRHCLLVLPLGHQPNNKNMEH